MESAKKVLLVEDNPGDARLLNEALIEVQPAPFALVHVDRFITAIEALKRETFSAVLLDLSLPDAKGLDTVVRMQREADAVPIVVLTGLDDDSTALEAVRAGAQDYLIKGEIDGKLLVRSLSYAMERKRLQEATAKHLNHIVILKDINAALTSTLELSDVLDTLLEKGHGCNAASRRYDSFARQRKRAIGAGGVPQYRRTGMESRDATLAESRYHVRRRDGAEWIAAD